MSPSPGSLVPYPAGDGSSSDDTKVVVMPGAHDARSGSINILIVDDEPANLVVLETVLDDPSYRLVRAESADAALLALVREEFAVLILDVRMPVMTGFELASMIKQRKKTARVPIIFLTAYYDKDQHVLEGYETGAVDYLNKPVNAAVLRSKVAVFADLYLKTQEVWVANRALVSEVAERRRAEEELRNLNETLERRVSERTEELRRADHKLQSLMNSITDGLFTVDLEWCFTYINDQGAQLLGKHPDDLLRSSIWDIFPSMRPTEFEDGLQSAVKHQQTVSFEAFYGKPLDKWFRCHCYPSEEGLSVYFHDVTDRRNVEERRQQLLEAEQAARCEGERVARSKDEFLATLSHELRTPLAAMLGWAAVIKRPSTDAVTLRRGIDAIERNAQAQSRLVADLLETSRVVSGKLRMSFCRLDLNVVAAAAADTARPAAQSKGVTLQVRENLSELWVMGDATRLEQVVANLLTNALKFTPTGGSIAVEIATDEASAFLSVSDTGQGIAPDFLPYLFERFSQADGSAARVHGGLGLGLSIAKHLVELHDGSITARSAGPGLGSTFTLRLPCASELQMPNAEHAVLDDANAVRSAEPGASLPSLDGISILLVDDHTDVLEVESRLLTEYGGRVTTASSSEHALTRLSAETYDVLLSDLGMPGMDGYALIEHIRGVLCLDPSTLPAIALTAFVRRGDWDRALLAGYQKCMQKPASPEALARIVSEVVRENVKPSRRSYAWQPATGLNGDVALVGKRTLRALFVEDNVDLQELVGSFLEEEGLELQVCSDGESAESEFQRGSFDLVVTDVGLPGISGVELAKRILANSPSTWLVFLTGYPMGDKLEVFGPRVRRLPKPFELEELQALMQEIRSSFEHVKQAERA